MVFFRCMAGLFDPVHRRGERVKWGIVSYTAVMFFLTTVLIAVNFDINSVSFIDNRQFPGGPGEYLETVLPMSLNPVADTMAIFNSWLADGLLVSSLFGYALARPGVQTHSLPQLYRCYIIYSMNLWAIVFPSLTYLGSVGAHLSSS